MKIWPFLLGVLPPPILLAALGGGLLSGPLFGADALYPPDYGTQPEAGASAGSVPPAGSAPLPVAGDAVSAGPPDSGPAAGPRLSGPESAVEPVVTIVQRDSATFEEYRMHGRLYKIKVTPKVGPPYYLVDETGSNVWKRYDSFDTGFQVPRWVILRF